MNETPQDMAQWMIAEERRRGVGWAQARLLSRRRALRFADVPTVRGAAFWREVADLLRYATAFEKEQMREYYRRHREHLKARARERYHKSRLGDLNPEPPHYE